MARQVPRIAPAALEADRPLVVYLAPGRVISDTPFTERGLGLVRLSPSQLSAATLTEHFRNARAIVVGEAPDDFSLLETHIKTIFAHGLRIVCAATSEASQQALIALRSRLKHATSEQHPNWLDWTPGMSDADVAQACAAWMAGPAESPRENLSVRVRDRRGKECKPDEILDWEDETLLRRAFADCIEVNLQQMTEGNSGRTFRVDARSQAGPRYNVPLPFIAKFDRIRKIRKEFDNYWELVDPAVPFHLRPQIDSARSMTGYRRGILVGSFVTESDSFLDVVAHGSAQPLIYSLHDSALAGWHSHLANPDSTITENLVKVLDDELRVDFSKFATSQFGEAIAEGATQVPDALLKILKDQPAISFRISPAHADLHGGNIRARRGDAILIDFYGARRRLPCLFDAACLEVSTAFSPRAFNSRDWQEVVETHYSLPGLSRVPGIQARGDLAWLIRLIRQIRLFTHANRVSESEYTLTIAYALLRFAVHCPLHDENAKARRHAYMLAERLILSL
jgi:hypothetical protein